MDPLFDRDYKSYIFTDKQQVAARKKNSWHQDNPHHRHRADRFLRRFSWEAEDSTMRGTAEQYLIDQAEKRRQRYESSIERIVEEITQDE